MQLLTLAILSFVAAGSQKGPTIWLLSSDSSAALPVKQQEAFRIAKLNSLATEINQFAPCKAAVDINGVFSLKTKFRNEPDKTCLRSTSELIKENASLFKEFRMNAYYYCDVIDLLMSLDESTIVDLKMGVDEWTEYDYSLWQLEDLLLLRPDYGLSYQMTPTGSLPQLAKSGMKRLWFRDWYLPELDFDNVIQAIDSSNLEFLSMDLSKSSDENYKRIWTTTFMGRIKNLKTFEVKLTVRGSQPLLEAVANSDTITSFKISLNRFKFYGDVYTSILWFFENFQSLSSFSLIFTDETLADTLRKSLPMLPYKSGLDRLFEIETLDFKAAIDFSSDYTSDWTSFLNALRNSKSKSLSLNIAFDEKCSDSEVQGFIDQGFDALRASNVERASVGVFSGRKTRAGLEARVFDEGGRSIWIGVLVQVFIIDE